MCACDWCPCVYDYIYKWTYGCGPLTFLWESLPLSNLHQTCGNKDHPDEDKENYFFSSKLETWESFLVEKKEKALDKYYLIGHCWHRKIEGELAI